MGNKVFFSKIVVALLAIAPVFSAFSAKVEDDSFDDRKNLFSDLMGGDMSANADDLEFVGDSGNIIGRGKVVVIYKTMKVLADKAIINIRTRDLEATGNVKFIRRRIKEIEATVEQMEAMRKNPNMKIVVLDHVTKATGIQKILLEVTEDIDVINCDRVAGNFNTGIFEFFEFRMKVGGYYVVGEAAERDPEGYITVKNVDFSSCEYIMEDHSHYGIHADEIVIIPPHEAILQRFSRRNIPKDSFFKRILPEKEKPTLDNYDYDDSDHEMIAYGCTFKVFDVPIFWMPILHKSDEPNGFGLRVMVGQDTDLGYFVKIHKTFDLINGDPGLKTKILLDFYSRRGLGWGNETELTTERSKTRLFGYWIYDMDPYASFDTEEDGEKSVQDDRRLEIPHFRYDMELSHINHITPRLDFRGNFALLSDINFLEDFFKDKADEDPQPASFLDLEYQFDHLSLALFVRPRINDFFSVVQTLPEIRADIPRQELFANIYYQGQTSVGYKKMSWRKYDRPRTAGNMIDPEDYDTIRVDTLHMFYYPFRWKEINIVPRAGFRITDYTKSSKQKVTTEDLETMFIVDAPDGHPPGDVVNYEGDGGNKFRLAGEIGFEINTKFYNSWQNVKNSFWRLDGLRHVIVPYLNYNYLPPTTVNRDNIYYFDDIDRINEQHFVRMGWKHRLQTRRGAYGNEQIYEWASMENYFDFHVKREKGYSHMGDFGTILNFTPFPRIKISSKILLNTGMSEGDLSQERSDTKIGDVYSKDTEYGGHLLNKWETTISYRIIDDLRVYGRYNYQNNFRQRSIYSMGSSLTDITSGSSFNRYFRRNHTVTAGIEFPIPIDEKTHAAVEATYDFDTGYFRENKVRISRDLHCWQASIELSQRRERGAEGNKETKNSVMFMLYLTQNPSIGIRTRPGAD